jgi:hypothetical protein
MKRWIRLATVGLLITLLIVFWKSKHHPLPIEIVPTLTGKPEYCLTCHNDLPQISPSHPVESFGCTICHGGQPLALEANLAHSTMRGGANPSQLDVVEQSCGGEKCHSGDPKLFRDHIQRVNSSIQATYAGAIANIRFTFGAQPDLQARMGISAAQDLDGSSQTGILSLSKFDPGIGGNPMIQAFFKNCLNCHISAEPIPEQVYNRFTGCAACHTPEAHFNTPNPVEPDNQPPVHQLTTSIPYTQCNTCHNRGNYDLRSMQFQPRTDSPTDRLHDYYQPIAQFVRCEWTLDCIDCHTRLEAMGDGDIHSNQKEIQYIQCRTCHGTLTELPLTRTLTDPEDLAFRLAFLNPVLDLKIGDTVLITKRNEVLWNVRLLPNGQYELYGKASRQRFIFNPVMGSGCQQKEDEQESRYCHECHAVER